MLGHVDVVVYRISRALFAVAMALIAVMAVVLAMNAALRTVGRPFTGVVEIVSHAMLALIMLTLPYTHRTNFHIRIDLLTVKLPDRAKSSAEVTAHILTALVTLTIAVMYLHTTLSGGRLTPEGLLDIPQMPFRVLVVVGFGLWGIEGLMAAARTVRGLPAESTAARVGRDGGDQ